jgi:hypothetical protein
MLGFAEEELTRYFLSAGRGNRPSDSGGFIIGLSDGGVKGLSVFSPTQITIG